jgi:CDP-diacylglycerol--glycerol-3-phosphate 3-phosphatidyltransferase
MINLTKPSDNPLNVPNLLSAVRLVMAIVVYVTIAMEFYWASLILFVLAAGTDWVDGWWARKFQQVTKLGRVFDPFVDKMLICGTFVMLAAPPAATPMPDGTVTSGIYGWVAVLIFAREMLVTGIRGYIEQQGGDFSAQWSGKWKFFLQCIALGASLVVLALLAGGQKVPGWVASTLSISLWTAIILTIYSGLVYVFAALKMMRAK